MSRPPRWDEVTPPLELPCLSKGPLERIDFVRYAGASGDFNRIHVEEGFAREAGYKSVFAHGMCTMAYLGQVVTDWLGGPRGLLRLHCRFRAIAWPGDVLTCGGRVERKYEEAGQRRLELSLSAVNQEGVRIADGSATVELPGP